MREIELPPEARALIRQVEELGKEANRLRREAHDDLEKTFARAAKEFKVLERDARREVEKAKAEQSNVERQTAADREAFEAIVANRLDAGTFAAKAWGEYEAAVAEREAFHLEVKSHPARSAAAAVRDKGKELAEARRQVRAAEYVISLYEWHFPWLTDLQDEPEAASYVQGAEERDTHPRDTDPASTWLTKGEWAKLSSAERSQVALERYLRSRKSKWQVGRDYERYIGYLREAAGCSVTYQGIFSGLEDLGRDVLAEKGDELEVIQCKRWAERKTIHEKHVFQLYGTVVLAQIERPDKRVRGTFTTTTTLSDKALEVADYLGITVEQQVPLSDYPRIKCNIARASGDRIYHLPFDQQYDKTVIEPDRGEMFVSTAQEAEDLGFRRAWRWKKDAP